MNLRGVMKISRNFKICRQIVMLRQNRNSAVTHHQQRNHCDSTVWNDWP